MEGWGAISGASIAEAWRIRGGRFSVDSENNGTGSYGQPDAD